MLDIVLGLIALWICFLMWERFKAFRYLICAIVAGIVFLVGNDYYHDYQKKKQEEIKEFEERYKMELREDFKKRHPEYLTECDNPQKSDSVGIQCAFLSNNDSLVDEAIQAEKDGKPLPKPVNPLK